MSTKPVRLDVQVRESRDGDVTRLQEIYAHHVLHGLASFEEVPPTIEEMVARRSNILTKGLPYFVASSGAELLGYAYAAPYRARSAYRFVVEDSVYVAQEAIGRGVGHALLHALIARCANLGCRQMIAVIGDSGHRASIGLHRRAGFHHVGTFRSIGFKLGRWVDSVLMQRELGAGDTALPVESARAG